MLAIDIPSCVRVNFNDDVDNDDDGNGTEHGTSIFMLPCCIFVA